jgi:hypothetical protein
MLPAHPQPYSNRPRKHSNPASNSGIGDPGYELDLRRTDRINDWDLVDISAHHVVGGYLLTSPVMSSMGLGRGPSETTGY